MATSTTKILLLEDNPGDRRLLLEAFKEIAELRCQFIRCETLEQALEAVAHERPDAGVVDLELPDARGLEVVRRLHTASPEMPIVVLTGLNDEALGIQALKEGAQDYLVKTNIDWKLLSRALRYAIERQRVQVELLNLSFIDDLTGLHNRRGFLTLAQHQIRLAYRTDKPFLVAFLDLDHLKHINDTFGHQEGNRALVETANLLRDSFRQTDILARMGGDEFAVFVSDATLDNAATVTQRVEGKLDLCNADPSRRYPLLFSLGVVRGGQASSIEEILGQADAVMYQEKQRKRLSHTAAVR
jgi:two-component system cell cycle response regulator